MSSSLTPCLIIVNDKIHLCVSPYPIRQISVMHQQGETFPKEVQTEYSDPAKAMKGLKAIAKYYGQSRGDHMSKKQEELQEKLDKSPFKIKKNQVEEPEEEYIP